MREKKSDRGCDKGQYKSVDWFMRNVDRVREREGDGRRDSRAYPLTCVHYTHWQRFGYQRVFAHAFLSTEYWPVFRIVQGRGTLSFPLAIPCITPPVQCAIVLRCSRSQQGRGNARLLPDGSTSTTTAYVGNKYHGEKKRKKSASCVWFIKQRAVEQNMYTQKQL